jgi:hypothetical protein
MKRHIAATPKCKLQWEKQITAAASKANSTSKSMRTHLEVEDFGFGHPNGWDDLHGFIPEPSPEAGPSNHAHVEDEENIDPVNLRKNSDTKNRRYVEAYPRSVGRAIVPGKTKFQELYDNHTEQGQSIYAPFTNEEEWDLAKWLSQRVGQKAIDEYLKLSIVSLKIDIKRMLQ